MAIIAKYIDSAEVESYLADGWSVNFCRFYQRDKMCYLVWREEDGLETRQAISGIPEGGV